MAEVAPGKLKKKVSKLHVQWHQATTMIRSILQVMSISTEQLSVPSRACWSRESSCTPPETVEIPQVKGRFYWDSVLIVVFFLLTWRKLSPQNLSIYSVVASTADVKLPSNWRVSEQEKKRWLPVRAVVCCFVTTKICPTVDCNRKETQQHLLMDCDRAQEVWTKLKNSGINVNVSFKFVMYGRVDRESQHADLLRFILAVTCLKPWKTRCAMIIQQKVIDGDKVVKQIPADLRWKRASQRSDTSPGTPCWPGHDYISCIFSWAKSKIKSFFTVFFKIFVILHDICILFNNSIKSLLKTKKKRCPMVDCNNSSIYWWRQRKSELN